MINFANYISKTNMKHLNKIRIFNSNYLKDLFNIFDFNCLIELHLDYEFKITYEFITLLPSKLEKLIIKNSTYISTFTHQDNNSKCESLIQLKHLELKILNSSLIVKEIMPLTSLESLVIVCNFKINDEAMILFSCIKRLNNLKSLEFTRDQNTTL